MDDLDQAIGIGGFQLGQHAVIHDCGNNGVLSLQLLQHIRIGRIAGLGLLNGRKPKLFKQKLSQLTGRIDIERFFGVAVYQLFAIIDPLGQHSAKLLQLILIDQYALALHVIQNRTEG